VTIPHRGATSKSTYFITADTFQKMAVLQSERMATLLIDVLQHYRNQGKFKLHEFVVMPNHLHLLVSPECVTLERSMQLIKGGFSFRAGKELGVKGEIWQTSFHDRRVRDAEEYQKFRLYIHDNPVQARLVHIASEWPYSSASGNFTLDDVPQRLKPLESAANMQA
jgi:putative transposase